MISSAYFFTWLGNWEQIIIVGVLVVLVLALKKMYQEIGMLFLVVSVAKALSEILKNLFERVRPDSSLWLVDTSGFAFPSGHATSAMALYGGIFYLLWKNLKSKKLKLVSLGIALVMIFGIGLSRVILRVHWFTDVLGGWLLGLATLVIIIMSFSKGKIRSID